MDELSVLVTISIIIFTSPYFSKILRIPVPPIEIMLGSLAGYFGFVNDYYLFELVAEVGFFYLMFLAGAEVDLRLFLTTDRNILKQGIIYLFSLYALSAFITTYLNLSHIFIVIMPLLSVGLIFALYKEYGKEEKWLNLAMLVGTMGELVSIALLTFLEAALEFGIGTELYKSIGYLILFLIGIIFAFRALQILFWWYPELKIYLMPHYDKDEKDIRLSMALFFMMIAMMLFLHLEIAFGAFIAGTFIATFFEHKKELPHKLSSFGFGFLVPTFFIYIGSTFDPEALFMDGLLETAFWIIIAMFSIRQLSSLVFLNHIGLKNTVLLGLSHSMPLTLMIAVATIAYKSNSIDQLHYFAFILASLIEVIIAMTCIKLLNSFYLKKELKN